MKKIYVITAFLGAASFAFNQVQELPQRYIKNTKQVIPTNISQEKAPGQVIWSSDFSNPSEWVIGGDGQQGAWQIGHLNDLQYNNYYFDITSTTVSNGFAFFEGIGFLLTPPVLQQNAWVEMANSINLTGESKVTFRFEQAYRAFNYDETFVEVSLDGGNTWEQAVDVNANVTVNTYSPEAVVVKNFNVNGSSNVKFRFRWHSETTNSPDLYGSGYAWQVDDVEIQTLSDYDIITSDHEYGSEVFPGAGNIFYYQIPFSQVTQIKTKVLMENQGTQAMTGVTLKAFETLSGAYSSTSIPSTYNVGDVKADSVTSPFIPPAKGVYKLEYGITSNEVDDVPSNNQFASYTFRVGDYVYARDRSTIAEIHEQQGGYYTYNDDNNPSLSSAMELGNVYHIFTTQQITGIEFKFGGLVNDGSQIFGHIFDGTLTQVPGAETIPYTVQVNDTGKYVRLKFQTPITLQPGEYVAAVTCFEPQFSVAVSGTSEPQTSFIYVDNDNTWYYTTNTPIVRMTTSPKLDCAQDPAFNYGSVGNVCISGNNSITPNQIATQGGVFSFNTNPSDGATINGSTGVISNVTPGTTYSVKYVTPDGNCDEVQTVTVNSYPSVSASALPGTDICVGGSATLQATGAGAYFWGVDLGNGDSHTVNPTGNTTYSVIGYNGHCRDTAVVSINVHPFDDASFSYSNFCAATTVNNVPNNVITQGGTFAFSVDPGDGSTIDPVTGEINNSVSGTSYTVEYTTSGACPSTSTYTLTVQDHDDATFTFDDACFGSNLIPTNIVTSGGAFGFDVDPGDGATINPNTGVITNATPGTSYDVIYSTPAGACQGSEVVTVQVFDVPNIGITATDEDICENETITLQASGGVSYSWNNGLGNDDSHNVSPANTITYIVTGTDVNGCTADAEVVINVNSLPTITMDDITVCDSLTTVELSASPTGGTFSGNGVSGNNITISGEGTYPVTYTYSDENGCENTATASVIAEECLGLAQNELIRLVVSPNPASQQFNVEIEGNNTIQSVQLISLQGQVIPTKYTVVDSKTTTVDVSKISAGTYFIHLNTNNGQLVRKIIVE